MRVVGTTIKGELKHAHSRKAKFVPECYHMRSDESQILGDERQAAQLSLDHLEEIRSWALSPMAGLSRPSPRRDVPRGAKSSKMVEPHQVHVSQQGFQPVQAPAVARATQRFPVIHRVAPKLSLGAEIVGRHAGHEARSEAVVELKPFGVGPNITGVQRHEERQIPNQAYASLAGIVFQTLSLTEQKELSKTGLIDLGRQVEAHAGQRRRMAPDQWLRPVQKIDASVVRFQGAEQRVI